MKFRLEVENQLSNKKNTLDTNSIAMTYTKNYLDALSIAEKFYGVTVSQEEVTKYIDENIAPVVLEEKEAYAKALGLTVYDRDIYVMDTLWNKLIPVLMERYPKQEGEEDNSY